MQFVRLYDRHGENCYCWRSEHGSLEVSEEHWEAFAASTSHCECGTFQTSFCQECWLGARTAIYHVESRAENYDVSWWWKSCKTFAYDKHSAFDFVKLFEHQTSIKMQVKVLRCSVWLALKREIENVAFDVEDLFFWTLLRESWRWLLVWCFTCLLELLRSWIFLCFTWNLKLIAIHIFGSMLRFVFFIIKTRSSLKILISQPHQSLCETRNIKFHRPNVRVHCILRIAQFSHFDLVSRITSQSQRSLSSSMISITTPINRQIAVINFCFAFFAPFVSQSWTWASRSERWSHS